MIAETTTRVSDHTPDHLNQKIRLKTKYNIRLFGKSNPSIDKRLKELDKEWDIERVLETNASSLIIIFILLGTFANAWFYLISFLVAVFLLQHAIQGWCPPICLLRRLGFRTHAEIASEHYALSLLRGDFDNDQLGEGGDQTEKAERAYNLSKW